MTDRPVVTTWPAAAIPDLGEGPVGAGPAVTVVSRDARLAEIRVVVPTVRVGHDVTPTERALLASCFGRRTARHDADGLRDAFAACGGAWRVESCPGHLLLSAYAVPERVEVALALIARMLVEPAYPADDVESAARGLAAQLRARRAADDAVLDDGLHRLTFAETALAELPIAEQLEQVTASRLHEVHAATVAGDGSSVIVVGEVDEQRVHAQLDALRSECSGPAPAVHGGAAAPGPGILVVDRPGSVQASIGMLGPAPVRGHARFPALAAAIRIVGGTATSRVSTRLRERRGWAYFANVFYQHHPGRSTVVTRTAVSSEYAAAAVNECHYELARAATTLMSDQDLADATRGLAGRLAVEVHTPAGLADDLAALAIEGAPPDTNTALRDSLPDVTVDDVRQAAWRYLAPSRLSTLVVGPADQIAEPLAALGPVAVVGDLSDLSDLSGSARSTGRRPGSTR